MGHTRRSRERDKVKTRAYHDSEWTSEPRGERESQ